MTCRTPATGIIPTLVASEAASATRVVHSPHVDGDGTNITGESGAVGTAAEDRGHEPDDNSDDGSAPLRQVTNSNLTGWKRRTTADGAFLVDSGGDGDDASEVQQGVVQPRMSPRCAELQAESGGGAVAGTGSDSLLDGIAAKVKTRRSPRRKLPAYLSASPDGFGAASRWGALSKAHLEFHRLGTAGEYGSTGEGGGRLSHSRRLVAWPE